MKTTTVILFLLMGLGTSAAFAQKPNASRPIQVEQPEEILTEADTFLSAPVRPKGADSGKTLRCWQFGRLLYEEKGFSRLTTSEKAAVTVSRQKGEGVSIVNLQDGLCILSDN
ncbi:MAG: hypothetical protein FWF12_08095 [Betaproteobacteria bacterium]|nr:hypothetical protein [Betaproteobacteria bacterium]